jgi:ubiquinone/menaquinone biosynthesis C-methylase UbiE
LIFRNIVTKAFDTDPAGVNVFYQKTEQLKAYDIYERYELLQRQVYSHLVHDMYASVRKEVSQLITSFMPKGKLVLELGCGIGHELHEISKTYSFEHYLGIDSSMRFLKSAQKLFVDGEKVTFDLGRYGLDEQDFQFTANSSLNFCLADAEDLPLKNDSADLLMHYFLFDRVSNPEVLIKEISRVLRPGGVCICATPFNFSSLDNRNLYGDPQKLNGLFRQFDMLPVSSVVVMPVEEPLDIAGNKIVWNTHLFAFRKVV